MTNISAILKTQQQSGPSPSLRVRESTNTLTVQSVSMATIQMCISDSWFHV